MLRCSISRPQLHCSLLLSANFDTSTFPGSKDLILVKYDQDKLHFVPTANTTNHLQHARSANDGYSFLLLSQNSTATLIRQFHVRCFTSEKHCVKSKYSTEMCPFQTGRDRKPTAFLSTQPLSSPLCRWSWSPGCGSLTCSLPAPLTRLQVFDKVT